MSARLITYDCKVVSREHGSPFRVIQLECRTPKQAAKQARKHGRVIGVKKASVEGVFTSIEHLDLTPNVYANQPEYKPAEYKPAKYSNKS